MEKETVTTPEDSKKRPSFGKKVLILSFCILLILVIVLIFSLEREKGQNQGTVAVKESSLDDSFDPEKEQKRYKGRYFSFPIPALYEEKSHEIREKGPVLETVLLSSRDGLGESLSLVVEERERVDPSLSPSFQKRQNENETYSQDTVFVEGKSIDIFSAYSMVFEETAFFTKENLVVSVSVTSPLSGERLREKLLWVLEGFE